MSGTDPRPAESAHPPEPQPRLNWLGQVLVALVLIAGLIAFAYGGLMTGLILGLDRAQPKLNAPAKGVGLAPDLSGLADATVDVILGYVGGLVGGLAVGGLVMWLAYRYGLRRLALAVPAFRRPA